MARIVLTAEVEDAQKWEAAFRTHADIFRSQTIDSPMRYTVNDQNQVAIYAEVKKVDKVMKTLNSAVTHDAMANDGVKRETVRVFVLDKKLKL